MKMIVVSGRTKKNENDEESSFLVLTYNLITFPENDFFTSFFSSFKHLHEA
jgi:hypothetical protein